MSPRHIGVCSFCGGPLDRDADCYNPFCRRMLEQDEPVTPRVDGRPRDDGPPMKREGDVD